MNARQPFDSSTDRSEQSLGSIAVELPGATALFRELKLDFCCHGNVSLRQAAADKGLDLADIQSKLAALEHDDNLPDEMTATALVDHIVARYHDIHRAQLPELIRMAQRVETVHKANPAVPAGLAVLLETMQADLFAHMDKEEQILFPMMRSGGHPFISQPIGSMRNEHVQHGLALEKLAALTNNATPPQGACNTWRALYNGVGQLSEDLMNHIHLENNVLFPAFEAQATPAPASGGCCGGGCGGH